MSVASRREAVFLSAWMSFGVLERLDVVWREHQLVPGGDERIHRDAIGVKPYDLPFYAKIAGGVVDYIRLKRQIVA